MSVRQIKQLKGSNFQLRPQNRKKGSGAGKTNNDWDPRIVAMAEGFYRRAAGGVSALLAEREWAKNFATVKDLGQFMDSEFPSWRTWDPNPTAKTPICKRLKNRVQKITYFGTSSRGPNHDPMTRAALSTEQLEARFAPNHDAFAVRDYVERGLKVPRSLLRFQN